MTAGEFDDLTPETGNPPPANVTPFPDRPPPDAAPLTRILEPAPRQRDPLSDINRALPYSDDAEKGVLSCFFQNPVDLLNDAAESLSPEAFYHPVNRQSYEELLAMHGAMKAIDLVTFSQHLIDKGLMDKMGGPAFFAELLSFVPTPAHYGYYKGILRDKWLLRRIIASLTEGIQESYEYQEDTEGLLDRIETRVMAIRPPSLKVGDDSFREAVLESTDAINLQMARGGELCGLSTGYPWLDQMTGGLVPGLYYIAARPSLGKTALALNIFDNIAVPYLDAPGTPCGVFSLEMSKHRLICRLIARQGWIPLSALLKGQLDKAMLAKFHKAQQELLAAVGSRIDDRGSLTLAQLKSTARRWKKQYGIKALFIDYLQRMEPSHEKLNPREAHARNSTGLAALYKELDIPIVCLAQLNRDCETEKRRPRMSDVEGCGRIEQDGDSIWLLSLAKQQPESVHDKHILFDIAKNRDGPTGSETHLFRGPFMRFEADPVQFNAATR